METYLWEPMLLPDDLAQVSKSCGMEVGDISEDCLAICGEHINVLEGAEVQGREPNRDACVSTLCFPRLASPSDTCSKLFSLCSPSCPLKRNDVNTILSQVYYSAEP